MDAEFRYLDGPFQGECRVIRKDFATIGRDPSADLTFDARADEGVSGRHAAVYRQGGEWMLRDLGGAGGTWLNDRRLRADTPLSAGDVIRLGNPGPRLAFGPREPGTPAPGAVATITRAAAATTEAPAPPRPRPAAAPVRAPQPAPARSRVPLVGTLVVVAAVAVGYALLTRRAVPPAPPHSRTPVLPDSGTSALPHSRTMQPLDLASVVHRARGSVVLVVAGYQDGRWPVGSGVIVEARSDTAWVATAARFAADPRGRPPVRIGLLLPGSGQYLRGELVVPLDGSGAALLRVRTTGGGLGPAPLGEAPAPDDSVAVIGVLLGSDSLPAGNWRQEGFQVSGTAAAIAAATGAPDRVDAPGHRAGPGHPVFDREGRLVGLVAEVDSAAPSRLRVIPAARIRELLGRRPRRE